VASVAREGRLDLYHGTTIHGSEWAELARTGTPAGYYHAKTPFGELFAALPLERRKTVAVAGLGLGQLSCYAKPFESWTFFEIDPLMERIARDKRMFSTFNRCGHQADTVIGDARVSLARAARGQFDLIILDAFTSDAIPVHLLTREALEVYLRALAPGGIIVFHVTNAYLNVKGVVAATIADAGLTQLYKRGGVGGGTFTTELIIAARSEADLEFLSSKTGWLPLSTRPTRPWTDSYSSLADALW
jgi:SAM-dependent methyltransferase